MFISASARSRMLFPKRDAIPYSVTTYRACALVVTTPAPAYARVSYAR